MCRSGKWLWRSGESWSREWELHRWSSAENIQGHTGHRCSHICSHADLKQSWLRETFKKKKQQCIIWLSWLQIYKVLLLFIDWNKVFFLARSFQLFDLDGDVAFLTTCIQKCFSSCLMPRLCRHTATLPVRIRDKNMQMTPWCFLLHPWQTVVIMYKVSLTEKASVSLYFMVTSAWVLMQVAPQTGCGFHMPQVQYEDKKGFSYFML